MFHHTQSVQPDLSTRRVFVSLICLCPKRSAASVRNTQRTKRICITRSSLNVAKMRAKRSAERSLLTSALQALSFASASSLTQKVLSNRCASPDCSSAVSQSTAQIHTLRCAFTLHTLYSATQVECELSEKVRP